MTTQSMKPPSIFMDRLMARIDPHQPTPGEGVLDAQRACGRWFALRRLRMGLTIHQIAGMAAVPVENILLLESGLGDHASLTESARYNLSRQLGKKKEEFDWVERVIAIAQGCAEALDDSVIAPVAAYLDAVDAGEIDRAPLAVEESAEAPAPTIRAELVSLKDEPEMFEVLHILADADTYIFHIWERVHKHLRLGIGEVGFLLDRMRSSDLVQEIAEPLIDPELDSDPLQLYRITNAGKSALAAEQRRREQEAVPDMKPVPKPG